LGLILSRCLTNVTHAVVSIPTKPDFIKSKVCAVVDICLGNNNAINGLEYIKQYDGTMCWRAPSYKQIRNGNIETVPVFKGDLLAELCQLALKAINNIKNKCGRPQCGHTYVVYSNKVIDKYDTGKEIEYND